MLVYHGSTQLVEVPRIELCRPHNDYGPGFYCTADSQLAKEWSCKRPRRDGFCNSYNLDENGLVIIDLDKPPFGTLNWLATLMEHRIFDMEWNAARAKERFVERYRVDLSQADIVCGYRADDSYFSIARFFVQGAITDEQATHALRLGNLGRQAMVKSQRAFEALNFLGAERTRGSIWYPRWAKRDRDARAELRTMLNLEEKPPGRRIYELIDEG